MAINSIGKTQAATAGFIPQVWAQEALRVFRSKIVLARTLAQDSDFTAGGPGFNQGDTLNISYPGTFTAQAKTEGNATTVQQPANGSKVALALSQFQTVDFLVEDWAKVQASPGLMERYTNPAAIALVEKLESDLFSVVSSFATSPVNANAGTTMAAVDLRNAVKQLNLNKQPTEDRFIVVSPKDHMSLLGDSALATFYAMAQKAPIETGGMPNLYGLNANMSQLVPQCMYIDDTGATGGTFTITVTLPGASAVTTGAITWSATPATMIANIIAGVEALTGLTAGDCKVVNVASRKYTVIINGAKFGTAGTMSATSSLTGTVTGAGFVTANTNFAYHKNAIIYAMRPLNEVPSGMGVQSSVITDPDSGISIRVQWQYDGPNRGVRVMFDILYGYIKLRNEAGVQVIN